ncbi:glutaminase B [Alteromonas facilis]|uniref:glutaminase B n=1 Tax=Alteromonas facilis TaxID=2048004 RepID=UPI000C28BD78|nr:glutaminase B [Alteromonas facilis]
MSIQDVLISIHDDIKANIAAYEGAVANYIPALSTAPSDGFAMAVCDMAGNHYAVGDIGHRFTIQSISKIMTLTLALQRYGDDLWQRVGKEPSGTAFNSLTQLEFEQGVPRNPFINAGAIVTCDALYSRLSAPTHHMLETLRELSGNPRLIINNEVARSEYEHRYRNAAMAYLMKSFGNFENAVDDVLKTYFSICAIEMNTQELAQAFSFLANKGRSVHDQGIIISAKQNSQLNSLLFTSGLYDATGDFAYRVGMPGKSGVGGAIVAFVPHQFSIAVWSPKLNKYGNSSAGLHALEMFADRMALQLF